jgi:Flp pilus assembly protein TadD
MRSRVVAVAAGAWLGACAAYQPFDSGGDLRQRLNERLGAERGTAVAVPFELDPELVTEVERRLARRGTEVRRVTEVVDFIFDRLDLQYNLVPTRNAIETYRAREGNCLSFVNLFIGLARHQELAPFYVEVTDQQRWNYRDGMVVSQGHIVAGMYVQGELQTYDFLPYRPKAYKSFHPIDDLTAAAHYYNNLGAEALMAGDLERAEAMLQLATDIAPTFVKAINNLGVLLARRGRLADAEVFYRRGLALEGDDVALLTNLAGLEQRQGRRDDAAATLQRIAGKNNTNPFFFVAQGEMALAAGDTRKALEQMVEALRRDSEVPEVHLGLVKVYLALGDLDRARHHLGRAVKLDATNAEARRLASLLLATGR